MSRCDNNCCAGECDSFLSSDEGVPGDDLDALKDAIEHLGYHVELTKKTYVTCTRGY